MKKIIYKGHTISYREFGIGKPVMLVHGFGEDGNVWQNQVDPLKEKFHLIIPDLPGSGASEIIDDMSMEGQAEVLKAIIEKEGTGPLTMIGHSMGGYITLAFAEKYADDLKAFGLFHSSSFADTEEKIATRRKGIEFMQKNGAFEFFKTSTPNLFSPVTKEEKPAIIDQQISSLRNFSDRAAVLYYEAMIERPDRTEILRKTTGPVLFVMGEHDKAVPIEDSLKQSHLPGKSYIHVLSNSGHMGMFEEPERTNRLLIEFLLET